MDNDDNPVGFALIYYDDDDPDPDPNEPLAFVPNALKTPAIGEAVTLVGTDGHSNPRRYRVQDVDHGYVARDRTGGEYTESTVAIYLIDANDPRRIGR